MVGGCGLVAGGDWLHYRFSRLPHCFCCGLVAGGIGYTDKGLAGGEGAVADWSRAGIGYTPKRLLS